MNHYFNRMQLLLGKAYVFLVVLILSLILFIVAFDQTLPKTIDYRLNQVAEKTVQAPSTLEDKEQTQLNRQRAFDSVSDVYLFQPAVKDQQLSRTEFFKNILNDLKHQAFTSLQIKRMAAANPEMGYLDLDTPTPNSTATEAMDFSRLSSVQQALVIYNRLKQEDQGLAEQFISLPLASVAYLTQADNASLSLIFTRFHRILNQTLSQEVTAADLSGVVAATQRVVGQLEAPQEEKQVLNDFVKAFIIPTVVYNEEETLNRRKKASEAVPPAYILQGQVIVQEGHLVDPVALRRLELYGFLDQKNLNLKFYLLVAMVVVHAIAILSYFTNRFTWSQIAIIQVNRDSSLYFCVVVGALVFLKALWAAEINGLENVLFLFPAFVVPYLVASQSNLPLTLITELSVNLFGLFMIHTLENRTLFVMILVFYLFSALYSLFLIVRKHDPFFHRQTFLKVLLWHVLFSLFLVTTLNNSVSFETFFQPVMFIALNIFLNYILLILVYPYWESFFSDKADLVLNRLANLNNPLLKDLIEKAPGTYQHSMMVANLASNAVEEIGGDSLLTRVAAYYHDVGKIKHPLFFVENIANGMESPHKMVSPQESAQIIINHVVEGGKMLKEQNFPKGIVDICYQHHGTTLVQFFYSQALKDQANIDRHLFEYPGPKPQSKEAAVIMIADSVEAASRTLKEYNAEAIERLVDKIIEDKNQQNQFEDCQLTLHELKLVRKSLMNGLASMYHTRIEYPDEEVTP